MHWYWQNVGKDNHKLLSELFFIFFSTELWRLIDVRILFPFNILEQIDGFWWNFVYAVLWLTLEIFPNFSTELWPLINVKILIFSSSGPKAHRWAYSIVRHPSSSSIRRQYFQTTSPLKPWSRFLPYFTYSISSEAMKPILTIFHI